MKTMHIKRMIRMFAVMLLAMLLINAHTTTEARAAADESTSSTSAETTEKAPKLNSNKLYLYVGGNYRLKLENANGKVKWSSSNKKIATVSKNGYVKARKLGTAVITAACNGKKYKCRVSVLSNEKFVASWCKTYGNQIKKYYKNPYDRVLNAAWYISSHLRYGNAGNNLEVLKKGQGTCYSGNKLLVQLLEAMGFKAQLRFAGKDKMSRYPDGISFGSQHYNVVVKIKGKSYYVDATPATGFIYMSTSKKPIYMEWYSYGLILLDKVPGHKK